ncbi:MAG TPA: glycosyltransferase family 4 protein, partial [Burkholderiaceae bacterium]|nr:glycosyltransferase family 4 protein [Burkholderiaceae bacterium]
RVRNRPPPRGGGQQAVSGLTAALAAFWPTELIWTERKTQASELVRVHGQTVTASVVPNRWLQRRVGRWLRRCLGVADPDVASMLCSGGNRRLVAYLEAVCQDGDVLLLAHPWLWPAARKVRTKRRLLLVYDAHNVEHRLKHEAYGTSRCGNWVVDRVRRLESELIGSADLTLACTRSDAAALAALAGVSAERFLIGSKGIALSRVADAIAQARRERACGRIALFVGSEHPPNNEAARWIIETLAPARPDWRFIIAGGCGPRAGVSPRTANVHVLGIVDDLHELLIDADIALNPVSQGSGINMKLFEYQQCALPVLSTPFGARGFEELAETGIVLAERERFASELDTIVADPERLRRLGTAGVACIRDHFTWPTIGQRVHARIDALLARPGGA